MSYKILEQNGIDNENIDGGALNRFAAGGRDGIVQGVLSECELVAEGNGVSIYPGLILLCGIRAKIESAETLFVSSVPLNPTQYQIVMQVTLSNNRDISAELFLRSPVPLRQDALYRTNEGIYQVEIGSFIHNPDGTLTNLIRTLDVIQGGGAGGGNVEIGTVTTETLAAGLEASFDVTTRVDENGKTLVDVYAGIPQGQSGKDVEAVHFTPQGLTAEQKRQARVNIGVEEAIEKMPTFFQITLKSANWTSNRIYSDIIAGLSTADVVQFIPQDGSAELVVKNGVKLFAIDGSGKQLVFARDKSFNGDITGTIIRIPWRG